MWELKISPDDRILVVSPHPDDESIGCGGLLLNYGSQCDVLLVTDGRTAHGEDETDDECARERQKEFEKVFEYAPVNEYFLFNVPDGKAWRCEKKLSEFDFSPYTKIFVPNRAEENVDHRAVNENVRRVMRKMRLRAELYEYEVWAPLAFPTHFLDISAQIGEKEKLIDCYKSQLRLRDYHAMVQGINAFRGVICHTEYAEAYEWITPKNKWKKRFFLLPVRMQLDLLKWVHKQKQ